MSRRALVLALALVVSHAAGARAADLEATVGTVTVQPGNTVDVPITVTPSPAAFGVLGIQLRLNLGASVVQSSSFVASDGWLWWWGAPAQNANATFAAAAAAGTTPVGAAGATLATVRVTVRADAPLGTDLPLTLSTLAFNEGSPSVSVVPGVLRVRAAGLDAPASGPAALALAPASPNPAARTTRLAFTLAEARSHVRLSVHALDGRLVRVLADGPSAAGRHDATWDLRDAAGSPVPAGLYFAKLGAGREARLQRIAVLR